MGNYLKIIVLLAVSTLFCNCTEPYALQTNTFEDALVIEATITDKLEPQAIKISHTYRFEENGPVAELGANVYIKDDLGTTYEFEEQGEQYVSEPFQAVAGRNYTLHITTQDGKEYVSTAEKLPTATQLDEITATRVSQEGIEGVQFEANAYDPTGTSKFYRYEYEETYKIITPKWSPFKAVVEDNPDSIYDTIYLVPRTAEARTCFVTKKSTSIILTSTTELAEDRVQKFPVHFIDDQNVALRERYSIRIRQYVQNLAAFTYYATLKEVSSGGGSILSQNQPGFFYGNIRVSGRPNEKVIGFFDVTSVSDKRVFYNYHDLFPDLPIPPYLYDCPIYYLDFRIKSGPECYHGYCTLRGNLVDGSYAYADGEPPIFGIAISECVDCTTLGSNVVPAFWQD